MYPSSCRGIAAAAAVALLPGTEAMAHGFAGDRFFPATILTDDPFVANEMSLPTITLNPTQSDGSREFDVGPDLSMRITPDLGFTIGSDWARIRVARAHRPSQVGAGCIPRCNINFSSTGRMKPWRSPRSM